MSEYITIRKKDGSLKEVHKSIFDPSFHKPTSRKRYKVYKSPVSGLLYPCPNFRAFMKKVKEEMEKLENKTT